MAFLYKELSGLQFNQHYKGINLYKFLNDDLMHHDFRYKLGLNIDRIEFNPRNRCNHGGLYFCEESKCHWFYGQYGKKLAYIEIPDDARVYVEDDAFKADKLIITKIINFRDIPNDLWALILPKDGFALKHVQNQTMDLCILAVKQNGYALEFVNDSSLITDELCTLAVKQNGLVIHLVNTLSLSIARNKTLRTQPNLITEELCTFAVKQNGFALNIINLLMPNMLTKKLCEHAIRENGMALKYVKDEFRSDDICELAIQQNKAAMEFISK